MSGERQRRRGGTVSGAGSTNHRVSLWPSRFYCQGLFINSIGNRAPLAFARGLKTAAAIRADGRIGEFIKQRYSTWDSGVGADIEAGKTTLADLEKYALANPEPMVASGRQEMIEGLINEFI